MENSKQEIEKPLITYVKRADKTMHKIQIPIKVVELFGSEYLMQVYKDKIILTPTNVQNDEIKINTQYGG